MKDEATHERLTECRGADRHEERGRTSCLCRNLTGLTVRPEELQEERGDECPKRPDDSPPSHTEETLLPPQPR